MSYEAGPVFIVSTGRSGSQMIARALAIHPALCALHEPQPHLSTLAFLKWSGRVDGSFVKTHLHKSRARLIHQVAHNRLRYVESSHYLTHLIPELDELFGPKFIHIYRDGRYFLESGLQRGWYQHKGTTLRSILGDRFRTWLRRRYLAEIDSVWDDHKLVPPARFRTPFEKIAWLWTELNGIALRDLAPIPKDRKLSVQLESFERPTLTGILEFLRLSYNATILDEMLKVARTKPNRSERGTTKHGLNWTQSQYATFNEIAGDVMNSLGYSNWAE